MEIKLQIKNTENLGELTQEKKQQIEEIISALISCGGLTGVKGGKTLIHFDGDGNFQAISFDYITWRKRRKIL